VRARKSRNKRKGLRSVCSAAGGVLGRADFAALQLLQKFNMRRGQRCGTGEVRFLGATRTFQREHLMLPKSSPKIAGFALVACAVGSLALSLTAQNAAAASRDGKSASAAHRIHRASAARRSRYFAHRGYAGLYGYAGPTFYAPWASNYVYVPGGRPAIGGCDLPTSPCSNDYRIND
jgi:hypothetical protein